MWLVEAIGASLLSELRAETLVEVRGRHSKLVFGVAVLAEGESEQAL